MSKKNIWTILLIVLVTGGLMAWGRVNKASSAQANNGQGTEQSLLTAAEVLYDFGEISMKNGNVSTLFTVKNITDKDITIRSVVTSCMCTTAFIETPFGEKGPFGMPGHGGPSKPANEIIKAGESRGVKVVYDPNAHGPAGVGRIDRFVSITDSDGGGLTLEIKANVTP